MVGEARRAFWTAPAAEFDLLHAQGNGIQLREDLLAGFVTLVNFFDDLEFTH